MFDEIGITDNTTVGELIKRGRTNHGYTQKGLADQLGYTHPNFIAMLEKDKAKFPLGKWTEFADALLIPRHLFLKVALRQVFPEMTPYMSFHPPKK